MVKENGMQKEANRAGWISGVALGLFLVASPFLEIHAQKKDQTQNQKLEEQLRQARAEVEKSVLGSMLLNTISVNESKWELNKAGYVGRGLHNHFTYFSMLLKKGKRSLAIGIAEHDSPEDAEERFDLSGLSYGGGCVPFNVYGDKGDKLIGQNGDLLAIRFRKGNYFVEVFTREQKTAERFAAHALKSLDNTASRSH